MGLNIYKNKTVFLTGDTGFKGSWLVIWLVELGAKVVGYALSAPKDGLFRAAGLKQRIKHIDGDVRDLKTIKRALSDARPAFVFHLAAQPLVLESYRNPLETFETNVMGTANLLEAMRTVSGIRAGVFIATDKVYENLENNKAFSEKDPLGGHDPYSASKAAVEIVVQSYTRSFFHKHSLPAIASARAGNVIGGGDFALHRIFPDCIRALKQRKPVFLRNPNSIRPWQHVLEPLYGYLLLGAALAKHGKKYSGAWNFGPSAFQAKTVKQLARAVVKEWGEGLVVATKASQAPHEAHILRLSSAKAKKLLGWHSSLDFKKSVKQTVNEYREMGTMNPDQLFKARTESIKRFLEALS